MFFRAILFSALLVFCAATVFAKPEGNPRVLMETSLGNVTIELYEKESPASVANFLAYANKGFYNGTIFHRVIREFMVQGGGFTEDLKQKPTFAPIKNEADNGLKNKRGTIAMARTNVVDSATAQFFINLVDNSFLDYRDASDSGYGYAVFGRVVEGMDVVDRIARCKKTFSPGFDDLPLEPIIIRSVKVLK